MDILRHFFSNNSENNRLVCLSAADLKEVLTPEVCFTALMEAYRNLAADRESEPKTLGFHSGEGTFHIKAGLYPLTRHVFAAKLNANFPKNSSRGLPTVQGIVALIDAKNGMPLAVMDSGELTAIRTAAAAALGAHYGARQESRVMTLIGCGLQGSYILPAFQAILPIKKVYAYDTDTQRVSDFAEKHSDDNLEIQFQKDLTEAISESDIIVTCTTSAKPILRQGQLSPGTFIAAVGADNPNKRELETEILKNAKVIVDDREKCAIDGEVFHAIKDGMITADDLVADLAELASGSKVARTDDSEIVIFDSVGTGLQDVAAAAAAYANALKEI